MLRALLLRRLAGASATGTRETPGTRDAPGTWDEVHTALRRDAERRGAGPGRLPRARLRGPAVGGGPPRRLLRAVDRARVVRGAGPTAPGPAAARGHPERPPWERYEQLVDFLNEGTVDSRFRTVTRLLAASWIAPEPRSVKETDRVGDPYRDPLGDPYAELYGEIAARFRTLAAHTEDVDWDRTLLAKAAQYEGKPW
ncbi:hypothetical protein NKH77_42205 [Streptomyces sp. M19]